MQGLPGIDPVVPGNGDCVRCEIMLGLIELGSSRPMRSAAR